MIKEIKSFINGAIFGAVQTIPGVSGGTVAIILGFYDDLIKSLSNLRQDLKNNLKFLIPLGVGTVFGILAFSFVTNYLITNHSFPIMLFFIGLIVGIIPLTYDLVKIPGKKLSVKDIVLIVIPIIVLVVITHLSNAGDTAVVTDPAEVLAGIDIPYMLFLFVAGALAAASLIIPGLSGSFVLLVLGIYHVAIYSASQITTILTTDPTNVALWLEIFKFVIPLSIGILVGGVTTVKIVEKLLKNFYRVTYLAILGLLIGSVYAIANEPIVTQSGVSSSLVASGIVACMLGAAISYNLGKKRL
ncbi:MAG: DUF368 domain-containing protein [Pseudomonadales bacterium]|jgi:putative membrane protein|nr:DUF368 domain-containing protein [Pseudomonadales bacterium]